MNISLWDTVKGPPPDLEGKDPFTFHSGFTPGTPVLTQAEVFSNGKVLIETRHH